jgi:tRNA threonylcarbamoyl adenosine modification protein YeaZ
MLTVNPEWLLVLETSVTNATLLLSRNGEIFAERAFSSERSQECDLFPPLRDLLDELPAGESLSAIIIGTGPGSYNGARVGIATAQALAQTHQCRVAGLCSFEAIEASWAIGDARRGSYFLLPLVKGRAQIPPELLEEQEFLTRLAICEGPRVTFESPDRLPGGIEVTQAESTATGLLKSWLTRTPGEQTVLFNTPTEAFYLRPPHITKPKKASL